MAIRQRRAAGIRAGVGHKLKDANFGGERSAKSGKTWMPGVPNRSTLTQSRPGSRRASPKRRRAAALAAALRDSNRIQLNSAYGLETRKNKLPLVMGSVTDPPEPTAVQLALGPSTGLDHRVPTAGFHVTVTLPPDTVALARMDSM